MWSAKTGRKVARLTGRIQTAPVGNEKKPSMFQNVIRISVSSHGTEKGVQDGEWEMSVCLRGSSSDLVVDQLCQYQV